MKFVFLFLPFTNGFIQYKPKFRRAFNILNPTTLDNSWTYSDLINNIQDVDGITIVTKDKISSELFALTDYNSHKVQYVPELFTNLMNVLEKNHIPFDFVDINSKNFLSQTTNVIEFIIISFSFSFFLNVLTGFNPINMITDKKKTNKIEIETINTKFNDVAGCEEVKFELTEIVDFLKNPEKYNNAGAKIPKGVLLEGPPGTGKTLLAKAVAGEAGVPFYYASGSQFIEMYVGVGASRVRDLFNEAKNNYPCVIFIDEIDAIGRKRGSGLSGGNDEREQTLNEILTNMDGFTDTTGLIVIAATNRVDILDSALTRPGRFDRKINVGLPDKQGRIEIMKVHLKNKILDNDVNLKIISTLTQGFSGADLANLANEAAILTVRNNDTKISQSILLKAFEKNNIGLPTKIDTRPYNIQRIISYHEIGHTLVALKFPHLIKVEKVTIQSTKNGAGGYTLFIPNENLVSYPTKEYILASIMIALGGRVAEQILFKNKKTNKYLEEINDLYITTGASNDIKKANDLARLYVNLFENIGIYDDNSFPNSVNKLSEYSKEETDKAIDNVINYCYNKTTILLNDNKGSLDKLSRELLKKKTLSSNELYTNSIYTYNIN